MNQHVSLGRVVILGGGPAGLYLAILIKKRCPETEVTVYERNPRGSTFGWGVVFSGRTMRHLEAADPESYTVLKGIMRTWENVDVVHRDETISIWGNRFSGVARIGMLNVLQGRCEELGVELVFNTELKGLDELPSHDLLVAADGVNSLVRSTSPDAFSPELGGGKNFYIWYGTHHIFDGLTLTFREDQHGVYAAHSYMFSEDTSTFIVEVEPETFEKAGFGAMSEPESRAHLEQVFAPDLCGHPLMSNASRWIQFRVVKNRTWVDGKRVLVGDAAHTAHFSIGSGTKLALEDCIALDRSLSTHPTLDAALAHYESTRKPIIDDFQALSGTSRAWFEDLHPLMQMEPIELAYSAITRSGRIDDTVLEGRDADFVAAYRHWLARA